MTSEAIRKKFIAFFEAQGHTHMPASSLIPSDPSVLFTTAGMQQFKPWFVDPHTAKEKNVITIQPCLRTSDIEEIGDDSHLTYFEMLGNFSFGGYGKEKAIELAWKFIKSLNISDDRVHVTVHNSISHGKDEDSEMAWRKIGLHGKKIKFGGIEDNFWGPTGNSGPCGPTTEIYVDGVEIWNIVFNEFFSRKSREESIKTGWATEKIPLGVDTGMGLERLALVLQRVETVFDTNELAKLMARIPEGDIRSRRIITDHARAIDGLIKDGVMPSNKAQGAVLRRLIRRVVTHGRLIGAPDDLITKLVSASAQAVLREEVEKFSKTLKGAIRLYGRLIQQDGVHELRAQDVFLLQESYGLPIELTEELARKDGFTVDRKGFEKLMEQHRQTSRTGIEGKFKGGLVEITPETTRLHTAHHLLLAALRKVLGDHVVQRGSNITSERLRIDISHSRGVTSEELKEAEKLVNDWIKADYAVTREELPLEEAFQQGALGEFGATYPERVSVYTVAGNNGTIVSREICGGPHVSQTSEIGHFKITKEESSGAGVRRIKATVS